MSPLSNEYVEEADVTLIDAERLCSDRCMFRSFDTEMITEPELDFEATFTNVRSVCAWSECVKCQEAWEDKFMLDLHVGLKT
jgi:hypothetical protein